MYILLSVLYYMQVIELTLNFMSPFVSKITLRKQLFCQGNRLKAEIIKLVENKTEMYLFLYLFYILNKCSSTHAGSGLQPTDSRVT